MKRIYHAALVGVKFTLCIKPLLQWACFGAIASSSKQYALIVQSCAKVVSGKFRFFACSTSLFNAALSSLVHSFSSNSLINLSIYHLAFFTSSIPFFSSYRQRYLIALAVHTASMPVLLTVAALSASIHSIPP